MSSLSVFAPRRFRKMLVADSKNVSRDPVLLFAILMALLPALIFVFTKEMMDGAALSAFGLKTISTFVAPIVLVLPAALIGWVTGFLILEDRDDGPLLALDITPVGKEGFTLHRATTTFAITFLLTVIATPQILPDLGFEVVFVLAIFIALEAVAVALALPAIARNKVEGLAITKVMNTFAVAPLLAIIPGAWRYIFGFIPSFWIGELLALSPNTYLALPLILGIALLVHLGVLWLIYRLLAHRVG